MRNNPSLESVDNALQLVLLLDRRDRLRVSEVATELGVAPSTAHRLLTTLKHRGFARQESDRSYTTGPALAKLGAGRSKPRDIEHIARGHLEQIKKDVDETTHLVVREEREVRFLTSVESGQMLRVTSRVGVVLPAHVTSGGRALLAELPPAELERLYPPDGVEDLDADGVARLVRELRATRRRGYGLNRAESERGIAALGFTIHGPDHDPVAALSVSVPTVRFSSARIRELVSVADKARGRIEFDLAR